LGKILNFFSLLVTCIICLSCKADLIQLSPKEVEMKMINGEKDFHNASFVDFDGKPLSVTLKDKLSRGSAYKVFYADQNNIIKQVKVLPIKNDSQIFNEIKINLFQTGHPLKEYLESNINCSSDSINRILIENSLDYSMFNTQELYYYLKHRVKLSQHIVIPYIYNCGWSADQALNEYLFFSIFNARPSINIYFYDDVKYLAENSLLPDSLYAFLHDRILTNNGRPQKYGTQSHANPKVGIHEIQNEKLVETYRKQVGLNSLTEQQKYWEIKINDAYLKY